MWFPRLQIGMANGFHVGATQVVALPPSATTFVLTTEQLVDLSYDYDQGAVLLFLPVCPGFRMVNRGSAYRTQAGGTPLVYGVRSV
jgi:hypothetical protein